LIYNRAFEEKKESLKIEETLGLFYESTKWLENQAIDLQYKLEEVAGTMRDSY
jgi:hypothetical protein